MAKRSFTHFVEQELGQFPHFFIFAALELVLIILLFIDGFLSFFANEFSKFFDLPVPCLLCTRIDHTLVHRNSNSYYNESICEAHKRDLSSLAYCHNHRKLTDIRKMCEACLLSFATERESRCGKHKSLVGILHKGLDCFVEEDHHSLSINSGKNDEFIMQVEKSSTHLCFCCGQPLKIKSSKSKGKVSFPFSQAPASSPRAPFLTSKNEENRGFNLPHIRCRDLKYISVHENDLPEDEDRSNRKPTFQFKEDVKLAAVPSLSEAEELIDDSNKTPSFIRGTKFFGISLTDSANNSPRWGFRVPKKSSLEKTVFGLELVEGCLPEGAGGDSIVHSLKRQVRLDRKSLMALYMELDEERSASAIAANNAMAMITRLQAEKAAMQMEALQYQRMMEEQAEYDQEALLETNDLLFKRDEEINNLEAELETLRKERGFLKEENFTRSVDESDEERNTIDRAEPKTKKNCEEGIGNGKKTSLTRALSRLSERVKAIGEDSELLEHASETPQKHSQGTKILTEISQNLLRLQNLISTPFQENEGGMNVGEGCKTGHARILFGRKDGGAIDGGSRVGVSGGNSGHF